MILVDDLLVSFFIRHRGVILIVGNTESFVTIMGTVRLTGTVCEIIIDILVLLQSMLFLSSKKLDLQVLPDCKDQLKFKIGTDREPGTG